MRDAPSTEAPTSEARAGFVYALAAYLLWGALPVYMKALDHIGAVEIVAHRIVWSVPVAALFVTALGHWRDFLRAARQPRVLLAIAASAVLISLNWLAYILSVVWNVASEAALGYYINPLISVLIGWALLGERLQPLQWAAVGLAAVAVAALAIAGGTVPWLALVMAVSFAAYGYLRKTVAIGPTEGFLLEVALLAPLALGYLAWLDGAGEGIFPGEAALLMGTGIVTAVPLILFASGAKRLTLATIGLMQYIAPTMIFLTAIFVFREPVGPVKIAAFLMIWTALALYSFAAFRPGTMRARTSA